MSWDTFPSILSSISFSTPLSSFRSSTRRRLSSFSSFLIEWDLLNPYLSSLKLPMKVSLSLPPSLVEFFIYLTSLLSRRDSLGIWPKIVFFCIISWRAISYLLTSIFWISFRSPFFNSSPRTFSALIPSSWIGVSLLFLAVCLDFSSYCSNLSYLSAYLSKKLA